MENKILDTFALQIINEYDIKKKTKYSAKDVKQNKYMATRYLQLQHKCKLGTTSGDGRSIWNGHIEHKGVTWDVSSCGTGVTVLSPGSVEAQKPIKTGSDSYSYGSGMAGVDEGLSAAILSDVFHKNGIPTERALAVIEFPGFTAVNVRASKNLVRPSHLFNHLRQGNLEVLTSATDYFIDRQIKNDRWPIKRNSPDKYDTLMEILAERYAKFAADLEDAYIFCWMDWDGDNMLATGAIIDYGSIRQLGACHHRYKYNDDARWSTTLYGQRQKARDIVHTFLQLVDFINRGEKRPLSFFDGHEILKKFDVKFLEAKRMNLLRAIGFSKKQASQLLTKNKRAFDEFESIYRWFETRKSQRGYYKVGDGVNWDAVFCLRTILTELARHFVVSDELMDQKEFISHIKSNEARPKDLKPYSQKLGPIKEFQEKYLAFVKSSAKALSIKKPFAQLRMRTSADDIATVTGDGILYVSDRLLRNRKKFTRTELNTMIEVFVNRHVTGDKYTITNKLTEKCQKVLDELEDMVYQTRHGI